MRTRFALDLNGTRKNLFSVMEVANRDDRTKTDLNIHFSSGGKIYRGSSTDQIIQSPPRDQFEDCHIHFSVHASVKSATVHSIHREILIGGKKSGDSVLLTTALKTDHLFAPIMFVICDNFDNGRFAIPDDNEDEVVTLAQLDPAHNQFVFMVVIAESGKTFPKPEEQRRRIFQKTFQEYELIVISSYFNRRAQSHTVDLVPFTTRETGPQRGLHWQEVYNVYNDFLLYYSDGYFARKNGSIAPE